MIKDELIGEVNNEMNSGLALEKVISALEVQKNTNGQYSVSHLYAILPA